MPTNIVKNLPPNATGNIMVDPLPVDDTTAKNIESTANSLNVLGTMYASNKIDEAFASGEENRQLQADQRQAQYEQLLGNAMAADSMEVFNQMKDEASRIKQAQIQGIYTPSVAQTKLAALQKKLKFSHPFLSREIDASMTAIRGNSAALIKAYESNPMLKASEDIIAKAMAKNMTPKVYLAREHRMAMLEMQEKQLDVMSKTKSISTDAVVAQSLLMYKERDIEVYSEITQSLPAMGNSVGNMQAYLDAVYKRELQYRQANLNERYLNAIATGEEPPFDLSKATAAVEEQLKFIKDLRDDVNNDWPGTIQYLQARENYTNAVFDNTLKREYVDSVLNSGLPMEMQWAALSDKAFIYNEKKNAIVAAGFLGAPGSATMLQNPEFLESFPEVSRAMFFAKGNPVLQAQMIGEIAIQELYGDYDTYAKQMGLNKNPRFRDYVSKKGVDIFTRAPLDRKESMATNMLTDPNYHVGHLWGHETARDQIRLIVTNNENAYLHLKQKFRNELAPMLVGASAAGGYTEMRINLNAKPPESIFVPMNPLHKDAANQVVEASRIAQMYLDLVGPQRFTETLQELQQQMEPDDNAN